MLLLRLPLTACVAAVHKQLQFNIYAKPYSAATLSRKNFILLHACSNTATKPVTHQVDGAARQRKLVVCTCRPGDISSQCKLTVHQSGLQCHLHCSGSSLFSCNPLTSHSNLPQGLCEDVCRLLTLKWLWCAWFLAQWCLKAIFLLLKLHLEWSENITNQPNVDALA